MKMRSQKQKSRAWTIVELLVVIVMLVILAYMLLPMLSASKSRGQRINCLSNLKAVNFSFRAWEGDHGNQYPMSLSVTNRGAMELIATGNIAGCFQQMTNVLSSPKILICPADMEHAVAATNFQNDFNNSHISYFLNPDASESYPQQIMTGDDNLAINDVPVKSGLLTIPPNATVSFTEARHRFVGNIGYADGSVAEVSSAGLQSSLILATNGTPTRIVRFAIP